MLHQISGGQEGIQTYSKTLLSLSLLIFTKKTYMISHLVGNPQGPSLSFSFFSCGPEDAAGAAAGATGAAVVAPFKVVFVSVFVFVFCAVLSASTVSFFSPSWSHGCALATAS
jgi:hypothetical protein